VVVALLTDVVGRICCWLVKGIVSVGTNGVGSRYWCDVISGGSALALVSSTSSSLAKNDPSSFRIKKKKIKIFVLQLSSWLGLKTMKPHQIRGAEVACWDESRSHDE
jgi:hypothetical protein